MQWDDGQNDDRGENNNDATTMIRFAPTRPPTHWPGVFSATSHGAVCPQVVDCPTQLIYIGISLCQLYVNIQVQKTSHGAVCPQVHTQQIYPHESR